MQLLALKPMHGWLVVVCLCALLVASVRLPAAPPVPSLAFASLSARATGRLEAHWDTRRGIPTFLAGRDSLARLPYTPTAAEVGNPVAIARGFLDANRSLFRLRGVASELEVLRVEPDHQLGYAHVRLRQLYHGIPVFGQQLVVHLDRREEIVAVNGHFRPDLQVPTQPTISADQAAAVALDHLLERELEPAERARVKATLLPEHTRLVVHVDAHDHATLTWQMTIMTQAPLGAWQVFVNARRPVVVQAYDNAKGAKVRRTFTAENTTEIPGRLVIEEGERSRDAIAQAAHDGAGTVYDYYLKLPAPYRARNGSFESVHELLQVKGVTTALFQGTAERSGLADVVTVRTQGPINVNTAGEIVLRAMRLADAQIIALTQARRDGPLPTTDLARLGVTGFVTTSQTFRIEAEGLVAGQSRARVMAIVQKRADAGGPSIAVLEWSGIR